MKNALRVGFVLLLSACAVSNAPDDAASPRGTDAGAQRDDERPAQDAGASEDPAVADDAVAIVLDDATSSGDDASRERDAARDADPAASASVRVAAGPTVNAELIRLLPIGTSAGGAPRRVVLRLAPSDLPTLHEGDVLMTPAEVELTTACDVGQTGPSCGYNPNVAAQLILTGNRDDVDPSGDGSQALSDVVSMSCTSAEHHCLFVFRAAETRVTLDGHFALPCLADQSCSVNLVMWAWSSSARPGGADSILVGENEGDYLANGVVQGDKARLMAIRERATTAADRDESDSTGSGTVTMPLDARSVLLDSHPLTAHGRGIAANEQFYVEARAEVTVTDRARFSTQIFLSRDPNATDAPSLDGIEPGSINEHNGGNCTSGTSPCTRRKVAVFRATRDIAGPVYVQFIGRSEVPGVGSAVVRVDRSHATISSTRYAADLW